MKVSKIDSYAFKRGAFKNSISIHETEQEQEAARHRQLYKEYLRCKAILDYQKETLSKGNIVDAGN